MNRTELRRRLGRSGLARPAALAYRTRGVARYDWWMLRKQARWLVQSREHTNLTLPLDPANEEQLAWFVANVTRIPIEEAHKYLDELRGDEELRRHVAVTTTNSDRRGLADAEARYGRRMGWYALTRALKPAHVVESGVDKGLGSVVLAAALLRNEAEGSPGRLTTIDISPDAGFLIAGRYATVVVQRIEDSLSAIRDMEDSIDLFIHDSDHDPAYELAEFEAVEQRLSPHALLISDSPSDVLPHYAERTGRIFLFFQERPHFHWSVGEGFGVAWRPA